MGKKAIKLVSIFIIASSILSLAGCKENENIDKSEIKLDPKNPVAIEIWHYYNGPQKISV